MAEIQLEMGTIELPNKNLQMAIKMFDTSNPEKDLMFTSLQEVEKEETANKLFTMMQQCMVPEESVENFAEAVKLLGRAVATLDGSHPPSYQLMGEIVQFLDRITPGGSGGVGEKDS